MNWENDRKENRKEAVKKLKEIKEKEMWERYVYVPHPSNPKTMIRKKVN